MMANWHFETCLSSRHTLHVYPNVEITRGRWGTKFWFRDSRMGGKVHGMDDYGNPILCEWKEYGFHMTIEKVYVLDKSRVIVDDYGMMLYAKA